MSVPTWLGIDYGAKRIGIAIATDDRRACPHVTLANNGDDALAELRNLCAEYLPQALIIGLPRGLDGQDTRQTDVARAAAAMYEHELGVPVVTQDEAVTSELAREQLTSRGESLENGSIDREAAAIILQDYLDMPS